MTNNPAELATMIANHLSSDDASSRMVGLALLQGLNPAQMRSLANHIQDEIQNGNHKYHSLFSQQSNRRTNPELQTAFNALQKYW